MTAPRWLPSTFATILTLASSLLLFWLLNGSPQLAHAATLTVCREGPPACDYATVQEAVDAAADGDTIKVAAGTYSDLHARSAPPGYSDPIVITQVVYLGKSIAIRGGYTTTNGFAEPPDPVANPTTLDARGQGRVLVASGTISPTVEGLRLTGGNATGLGGVPGQEYDAGGGVYVAFSTITLSNNRIFGNTADRGGGLALINNAVTMTGNTVSTNSGSGLFLCDGTGTFVGNTIMTNTAALRLGSSCGGLFLSFSNVTLLENTISANTASASMASGGGLCIDGGNALLRGNTIVGNTATAAGGGVSLSAGTVTMERNIIQANAANAGGGLYLGDSDALLFANTIRSNQATKGGGLYLVQQQLDQSTLVFNTIRDNNAGKGGGIYLALSDSAFASNIIRSNMATEQGGGMFLEGSNVDLTNNAVLGNQAVQSGSGLYLLNSSLQLVHSTITGGGENAGLVVISDQWYSSTVQVSNTILVSHTVGISVSAGSSATLDGVLWFNNDANTAGAGAITITNATSGDPLFAADGYHLQPGSAALDRGSTGDTPMDIDGEYRPGNSLPDLGADELLTAPPLCRARLNGGGPIYTTVQQAIAASTEPSDTVEVAGICEDTVPVADGTVVVLLTKTLTLRGGYSPDFSWDPAAYPTVLNGHLRGSVLAVEAGANPTIEYLTLLGGVSPAGGGLWSRGEAPVFRHLYVTDNVAERGGGIYVEGPGVDLATSRVEGNRANLGGGIYVTGTTATISNTDVLGNAAGTGGGLYAVGSDVAFNGNTIAANHASEAGGGLFLDTGPSVVKNNSFLRNRAIWGGGLYARFSTSAIQDNIVSDNRAEFGGGLYLRASRVSMTENTISTNTGGGVRLRESEATIVGNTIAWNNVHGPGGGLSSEDSDVIIGNNTISANEASGPAAWTTGGGLCLRRGTAQIYENTIADNAADREGGGLYFEDGQVTITGNNVVSNTAWRGGGLYVSSSEVTLTGNDVLTNTGSYQGGGALISGKAVTVTHNTFSGNSAGDGGGLALNHGSAILEGNTFAANRATHCGGGLILRYAHSGDSPFLKPGRLVQSTMVNNLIADNWSANTGSGLCVLGYSARLLHTTLARNYGGDGSGIYLAQEDWSPSTVTLSNTVLVGHTVGVTVTAGCTVTMEATLWGSGAWSNQTDWAGAGTILTGTTNLWSDPAFVDPDAGNYHLGPGSAALNAGIDAGVLMDIDGEPRPAGPGYDIGADELWAALIVAKQADHNPVEPGGRLTYTLQVTNAGYLTLTATITDVLPLQVTPSGILTWTVTLPVSGGTWTQTIAVTVAPNYVGPLVNVAQVRTAEGATGTAKYTVIVGRGIIYLPLILK